MVIQLVMKRLEETDAQVNGWVLDGFPQNDYQVNAFQRVERHAPTLVCEMLQDEGESIHKLSGRKMDPFTGEKVNMEFFNTKLDEKLAKRLVRMPEDEEPIVRKRYKTWNKVRVSLENEFRARLIVIIADRLPEQVTDQISDAITNPVF